MPRVYGGFASMQACTWRFQPGGFNQEVSSHYKFAPLQVRTVEVSTRVYKIYEKFNPSHARYHNLRSWDFKAVPRKIRLKLWCCRNSETNLPQYWKYSLRDPFRMAQFQIIGHQLLNVSQVLCWQLSANLPSCVRWWNTSLPQIW